MTEESSPINKVGTPGDHAFPIWDVWVLNQGPFGHPSLVLRTDHRAESFSEFLVVDLETREHKGVVLDNLGEVGWGCFLAKPGTGDHYALRPEDIYRLDFKGEQAIPLQTGGFGGHLLPETAWQDPDTLWVIALSENAELFRVAFDQKTRVEKVALLRPPEKKVSGEYIPRVLRVTPGGKVWAVLGPGLVVAFLDPARHEPLFICNLSTSGPEQGGGPLPVVKFHRDAVQVGNRAYALETGDPLADGAWGHPRPEARMLLGKRVGDDGKLHFLNDQGGRDAVWGGMPPERVTPGMVPSPMDRRYTISWYLIHGENAYGTSASGMGDQQVGLMVFHGPTGELSWWPIPWKPRRPQKFYSMHLGPDGSIYGSNYSPFLWRMNPSNGETQVLGCGAPPEAGGEIWSLVNHDGKIYFASYTRSWLSVYDPAKPWRPGRSRLDNPRNLFSLLDHAPAQHCPRALTVGSTGWIYMASCERYGSAGQGALAAYDPREDRLVFVEYPLVPGHQLLSLASSPSRGEIYIGTYRGQFLKAEAGSLVVWDEARQKIKNTFSLPNQVSYLASAGDFVAGVVFREWSVFFYHPESGEFRAPALLEGRKTFYLGVRAGGNSFLLQQEGRVYELDPLTFKLEEIGPGFVPGSKLVESEDGTIYFAHTDGYDIYRFRAKRAPAK